MQRALARRLLPIPDIPFAVLAAPVAAGVTSPTGGAKGPRRAAFMPICTPSIASRVT
jgi:hypothetical protein